MKVVYLHQYFNSPAMAGGTRSYEMARRLVAAGHEVDLITTWREPSASRDWFVTEEAGIRVHWLPVEYSNSMSAEQRIRAFLRFAWESARKAAELGGDVIFATSTPLTIALPGIYASWRRRVPMVFEVRDMWPDVPIAFGVLRNPLAIALARGLERYTYRYATHIVTLAPGMADDVAAKGIPRGKITVIPNGCDVDVFGATPTGPSPRGQFAWLGSRKLALYAGTLGRVAGVGYLVRLAAAVERLDPEIRFVVIGEGAEQGAIRAAAEAAGLLDRTFFMFDAMPKRDLVPWLHASDLTLALFAGPRIAWKDAVQNKFFDSLAAGKPIACNFEGWQSQIAVESGVGFIMDREDMASAARDLVAAIHDAEWLAAVPARAEQLVQTRFERGLLAGELEKVLRSIAGRRE